MKKYIKTDYNGCEYITAGKWYEVVEDEITAGEFIDDQGERIYAVYACSGHIDGHPFQVTTVGTLAELDVKPGDVVEFVAKGENRRGYLYPSRHVVVCSVGRVYGISPKLDDALWRIISRESGTPTKWRDMSDEEKGKLLLAWQRGKVIENDASGGWVAEHPVWADGCSYRIKPEPVVDTVEKFGNCEDGYWMFGLAGPNDTHRITFTTTDGKPDLDSIKMEEV